MVLNISELVMLNCLHRLTGGSGERISLDPKLIMRNLGVSVSRFTEDVAALAAHGFAGVRHFRPNAHDVPSSICSAIWLTGKGETYLKELRSEPRPAMVS